MTSLLIFLSTFANIIIPLIPCMCQEGWANAILPPGILQGDITLIPKTKDQEQIENKRPITLLKVVYNFFTKLW